MDGVLWKGETPMPGLANFFTTLKSLNINYVLATNNATKTAAQYTQKIARLGVNIPSTKILTSAETTAVYLRDKYRHGTAVYIVGEKGLYDALDAHGFQIISPNQVQNGTEAQIVVVGFNRQVTYQEMAKGALLIHHGASFIGTNPDPTFPSENGPIPGAGSLLAFIATATDVQPIIIGKPGPIIFREALKRLGATESDTAMVGDRLTTDIAGGNEAGLITILLLSGISSKINVAEGSIKPDFVLPDLNQLALFLTEHR